MRLWVEMDHYPLIDAAHGVEEVMPNRIDRFIARLRETSPWMIEAFTHGACWQFYLILRELWPEAEPWYAYAEGHVYTRIGRVWYDIRGKHVVVRDAAAFARIDPAVAGRAHRWIRRMDVAIGGRK